MPKKAPIIGTIFSSEESSSDTSGRESARESARASGRESARESARASGRESAMESARASGRESAQMSDRELPKPIEDVSVPHGYVQYDLSKVASIATNTSLQYVKKGHLIKNKYFKKYDQIGDCIVVGFSPSNRRNYSEDLGNIDAIFVKGISGGAELAGTIDIAKSDWRSLKRDMVLSYKKKDTDEWVYEARFNAFIKGRDGSTRMSMTSKRGYAFTVNPDNITTIKRHFTASDNMNKFILEKLHRLEQRVHELEKKTHRA